MTMPAHVSQAWDDLRPDTRITRCHRCGSWQFIDAWCDTCDDDPQAFT